MSVLRTATSLPMPFIVPGLRLWHSAADPSNNLSVPANGTGISSWSNKMAGGANASTQGTGANQPVFTTNVINGRPGLVFDGSNDQLQNAATGNLAISTAYSIYCVVALASSSSTGQSLCSKGNSTADPDFLVSINRSSANSKLSIYDGTGWNDSSGTITTTTAFNVLAITWSGSLNIFSNGATLGFSGTPVNLATSAQNFVVGGQGASGTVNFLNGTMLDLLVYGVGHTSDQVLDITRYFGNYYGLNF